MVVVVALSPAASSAARASTCSMPTTLGTTVPPGTGDAVEPVGDWGPVETVMTTAVP